MRSWDKIVFPADDPISSRLQVKKPNFREASARSVKVISGLRDRYRCRSDTINVYAIWTNIKKLGAFYQRNIPITKFIII
jgi:hypothetical protein